MLDRDKLNGAPRGAVAQACVQLFDRIQHLPREIQLLALAGAFVLMSKALRFDSNDTYQAITNLMKDPKNSSGMLAQFDAMRFHIETELSGDEGEVHLD